ncbi:MAG: hypothetical protein ABIC95_05750 [archaeon]
MIKVALRFLLMCPHCGKQMQYHTYSQILTGKRKSCVYCGKSFGVRAHIVKRMR